MMQHRTLTSRPGAAIILALVVLAVLTLLLTVMTKQIVAQRRMAQQRQRQLQADWSARAGLELAAARLLESPTGFVDDAQQLLPDAKVRIVVEKASAEMFTVTAEAMVGAKDEAAVVRTASTRYRRTDADGVIRVQAVGLAKGD